MRKSAIALALAVSGCAGVNDVQEKPAFVQGTSQKIVNDISACVAQLWGRKRMIINSVPIKGGTSITLSTMMFGSPKMWAVADVVDEGAARTLILHQNSGSARQSGWGDMKSCL